ncbi:serine hydrolase domain-containing protein [Nitriliruptor alkaliphilus]|uniref:serine hydrolase domain-containing protein n=1 Tax=Nitriliruptor alkaliphilus TaxID=427918 RepID=UPI0006975202|nr:serine hydrolase domain-containing protein [Nitriliruptor alkaliphilus]
MRYRRAVTVLACTTLLSMPLATSALAGPGRGAPGSIDGPWDRSTSPPRILREGTPQQAGLVAEHLAAVEPALRSGLEPQPTPVYPGAVALVVGDGVIAERSAVGHALRWNDPDTQLPEDEWVEVRDDTIFDLASLSKLFTAVAIMQLVEDGALALDDRVADHIPAFGANGKQDVTVGQLLTHTSGLAAWLPLYSAYPDRDSRIAAVHGAAPTAEPGSRYLYSDLGLIALGELVGAVSGQPLDRHVAERITGPLGMDDTGYNPDPSLRERIAATEYQPWAGRGLVHGEVHDENAWSLGGVAGHAGVFATADDLAVFAQMLLNGGRYGTVRILDHATVEEMMTERVAELGTTARRGLGPEMAARFYHDAMTSPHSAGHTGFTGTSLVIDPHTDTIAILLTNRVHPSRDWAPVNPVRRAIARATARAVPVRPLAQGEAWFSELSTGSDRTLTVPVEAPAGAVLEVDLWFDTAPGDHLVFESSSDGGETWQPLAGELTASGAHPRSTDGQVSGWGEHRWWSATFPLQDHAGERHLRARYVSEALASGRGVYLDGVRVVGPDGPVLDDRRPEHRQRFTSDGWTRTQD